MSVHLSVSVGTPVSTCGYTCQYTCSRDVCVCTVVQGLCTLHYREVQVGVVPDWMETGVLVLMWFFALGVCSWMMGMMSGASTAPAVMTTVCQSEGSRLSVKQCKTLFTTYSGTNTRPAC